MIVYVPEITARVQYIFDHLFKTVLGIDYPITCDEEEFTHSPEAVKLSYGKKFNLDEIYLHKSSEILFEKEINQPTLDKIFQQNSSEVEICFAVLTRYQEYLPFQSDVHGRFPYEEDLFFQPYNIEIPLVDQFAFTLKNAIRSKDPSFSFPDVNPTALMTIDVDRTWKFRGSSLLSFYLKGIKYALKKEKDQLAEWGEFKRNKKDPYDTFTYIQEQCMKQGVSLQYFYLLSNYKNLHDRNITIQNPSQAAFIHALSENTPIGIHPSYGSESSTKSISKEKQALEEIIQKPVTQSRQHYIRLAFPVSYQSLIDLGIQEEYSMGFPERIGFRAGTSHPFYWFDLTKNKKTELKIFPFCVMDVTLKNYMQLSPENAILKIQELQNTVQQYGGVFIPIFHNQNLTDNDPWKGWRKVYEQCLKPFYNDSKN